MSGDSYQPLIDVPNVEAITLLHVSKLENGATAIPATENGKRWNLDKSRGGAANGYSILRPAEGSPRAGADDARWILQDTAASSLVSHHYDALADDTVCPADALTSVASFIIPITETGRRVRIDASIGCLYDRAGVAAFHLEINGSVVTGAQVGYDVATLLQKSFSLVHEFVPNVGNNTVRLAVRPTGPLSVSINASSEPSIRHAHLAALVFSS